MNAPPDDPRLDVARELGETPIARWLNYSATVEDGELVHRLGFGEEHIGNALFRALHGGVVATFLELAAQVEYSASRGKVERLHTHSLSVDYMNAAKAEDMTARVSIARAGRRVAFLEATGWQSNPSRPVATARVCLRIGGGADK